MSKPIIDIQTIKTICQGALGAMTFGAYHQFNSNKIMDQNNQIMTMKHKLEMEAMEEKIKNLENQIKIASSKSSWW
jgi:hypothetical protein